MTRHECRLCSKPLSDVFVDLGTSPLSNAYLKREDLLLPEVHYPLVVYVCTSCGLVQLPAHETPEKIFGEEYLYFSSYSASWVGHAKAYADKMMEMLPKQSLVVELASNDGYLLQHFKERGVRVLGVEPAPNVADVAIMRGIPTVVDFFGTALGNKIRNEHGRADLICGANVLAHVPDLHDFIEGIRVLLAPGGIVTMEFPYLFKLIEQCQFDTIYQEHYSYFSLRSVMHAFLLHGLAVFDVEELSTHGGSIRIYASHAAGLPVTKELRAMLEKEKWRDAAVMRGDCGFEPRVRSIKHNLVAWLTRAAQRNIAVVGYGAPAKATTLLNYCGIRSDLLQALVDDSPHKQDRFVPGVRIPILHPDVLLGGGMPGYVLVMPWNLYSEIEGKIRRLLPDARVINPVSLPCGDDGRAPRQADG
jgi:SAM-dependent methyltransferase